MMTLTPRSAALLALALLGAEADGMLNTPGLMEEYLADTGSLTPGEDAVLLTAALEELRAQLWRLVDQGSEALLAPPNLEGAELHIDQVPTLPPYDSACRLRYSWSRDGQVIHMVLWDAGEWVHGGRTELPCPACLQWRGALVELTRRRPVRRGRRRRRAAEYLECPACGGLVPPGEARVCTCGTVPHGLGCGLGFPRYVAE